MAAYRTSNADMRHVFLLVRVQLDMYARQEEIEKLFRDRFLRFYNEAQSHIEAQCAGMQSE